MLKREKKFEWTPECEETFREIKEYLTLPPTLSVPESDEIVFVYLATSDTVISSVLVRDIGRTKNPIFYISRNWQMRKPVTQREIHPFIGALLLEAYVLL